MKVIGLTGRIGCGKSTVAALLREHRAATIDADEVAREVRAAGTPEGERIRERFGTLDPQALGAIVFSDPQALLDLEAITHPRIREVVTARLTAEEESGAAVAVVEAVKLLGSPLRTQCDQVWVVVCDEADARRRLAERGLSPSEVDARLANQVPLDELREAADVLIDGSTEIGETARQVEAALASLLA